MKSLRRITSLSVAGGLILFAAFSTVAQQPRPTGPSTTAPRTTPSPAPTPAPTQTTPNPAPTQTTPNPAPTQTTPNPSPTQTFPNSSTTQTVPNPSPTQTIPNSTLPGTPGAAQNRSTVAPQPNLLPNQFTTLDLNRDTRISVEEFNGPTLGAFRSMDRNGDGRISGTELTDAPPANLGVPFPLSSSQIGELDTNRDLQLSDIETSSGVSRLFKNLDINGDGYISEAELNGRPSPADKAVGSENRNTDTTDSGVNRSR